MEIVTFLVEEFHLDLAQDDALDAIFRAEAVFGLGAGFDVAQLGLDHSAPVARRDMADCHHPPEAVVVLQDHPGAELRGLNQHRRCTREVSVGLEFSIEFSSLTDSAQARQVSGLSRLCRRGRSMDGNSVKLGAKSALAPYVTGLLHPQPQ